MSESDNSYGWQSLDEDEKRKTTKQTTTKGSSSKSNKTTHVRVKPENLSEDEEFESENENEKHQIKQEPFSNELDLSDYNNDSKDSNTDNRKTKNNKSMNGSSINTNHSPRNSGRSMRVLEEDTFSSYPSPAQKSKANKNNYNNEEILNKYLKSNSHLTNVSTVGIADIGDDEDLWLFQCPRNLNLNTLKDIDLLQNKKRIKLGGAVFECVPLNVENELNNVSLLTPPATENSASKIKSHKLNGAFLLREKLKSSYEIEVVYEQIEKTPSPAGLRKRHPLFGTQYKNMLKLPSDVIEKLKNPTCLKEQSKKKPREIIDEDHSEVQTKSPKKRKRKADNSISSESSLRKRIKKEPIDMWTSEISIEENLFQLPIKNIKRE